MAEETCYLVFSSNKEWIKNIKSVYTAAPYGLPLVIMSKVDNLLAHVAFEGECVPEIILIHSEVITSQTRELIKRIRKVSSVPITVLEGLLACGDNRYAKTTNEIVQLLQGSLGESADNYIGACTHYELFVRIQAQLRRYRSVRFFEAQQLSFRNLEIELFREIVWIDGEIVYFPPQLFALLVHFVMNKGRVISYGELMRQASDEEDWGMENLKASMKRMRKILKRFRWDIKNIRGVGYILTPL